MNYSVDVEQWYFSDNCSNGDSSNVFLNYDWILWSFVHRGIVIYWVNQFNPRKVRWAFRSLFEVWVVTEFWVVLNPSISRQRLFTKERSRLLSTTKPETACMHLNNSTNPKLIASGAQMRRILQNDLMPFLRSECHRNRDIAMMTTEPIWAWCVPGHPRV